MQYGGISKNTLNVSLGAFWQAAQVVRNKTWKDKDKKLI